MALVAYMLLFHDMTLFPGDTHGGGNHSLLLSLSSSDLWSAPHWRDVGALFFLGAPAALPALLLGRVRGLRPALLFVSGFVGPCLFLALFNAALGWLFDIDMLIGALIPSQTLGLYFLFARRSPPLWTAALGIATAAGSTAFLWNLCNSWPPGAMHHF